MMHYPGYRHPLEPGPLTHAVATSPPNPGHAGTRPTGDPSSVPQPPLVPIREFNPDYNITEAHRLCRNLTVEDDLRHERTVERKKQQGRLLARRQQILYREGDLRKKRDEEFTHQQLLAQSIAGTAQKNRDSEDRDVITHRCNTRQAQEEKDYRDAVGRHSYHLRQRRADARNNLNGYNIITWERRPEIYVPPMPVRHASIQDDSAG